VRLLLFRHPLPALHGSDGLGPSEEGVCCSLGARSDAPQVAQRATHYAQRHALSGGLRSRLRGRTRE